MPGSGRFVFHKRTMRRPSFGDAADEEEALSLYLKQIEQLISLQKVDDEIHGIKQELEGAPKEVESLRARFAEALTEE